MKNYSIILFDGVCNLCTWSVQFIIKRDPQGRFRFASMQSPTGQRLLKDCGLNPETTDTFVLIEGQSHFTKSDAILKVATYLSGIWPLFRLFSLIPRPIRDPAYHLIARNRYTWFGKRNTCMIPSKELLVRFLGYLT